MPAKGPVKYWQVSTTGEGVGAARLGSEDQGRGQGLRHDRIQWMRGVLEAAVGEAAKMPAPEAEELRGAMVHALNNVGVNSKRSAPTSTRWPGRPTRDGAADRARLLYIMNSASSSTLSAAQAFLERAAA